MSDTALYSVLLVGDNAAMREALARSLARRGCRVTTATTDAAALETLRERAFDAVITDLNMSERGGLWLWRQVQDILQRAPKRTSGARAQPSDLPARL